METLVKPPEPTKKELALTLIDGLLDLEAKTDAELKRLSREVYLRAAIVGESGLRHHLNILKDLVTSMTEIKDLVREEKECSPSA